MSKTIEQFFTPASRTSKRQRSSSSPGDSNLQTAADMDNDLVGQLTVAGLSRLLEENLSNVATKQDVNILSKQIEVLKHENYSLRQEITSLKFNEKKIMDNLIDLESRSRRNNLIFKGLKVSAQTKDYKQLVVRFCNEKPGMASSLWVNRAHPLGKDGHCIIAHFPDDCDIQYIMTRIRDLNGTGVSIFRDFSPEVRHKRARLAAVRAEVERVAGRTRMPMIFDHVVVKGFRFTWEGDKLMAEATDGAEKLNLLFNHDFNEFLNSLKERGPSRIQPQREPEARTSQSTAPALHLDHMTPGTPSPTPTPAAERIGRPTTSVVGAEV